MAITNVSEAKASLSHLLRRVQQGEEIIIGRAGKPVARLVAYEQDTSPRQLGGSWEGRVELAADFDDLPEAVLRSFQGDVVPGEPEQLPKPEPKPAPGADA